jgi:hypothetical protein
MSNGLEPLTRTGFEELTIPLVAILLYDDALPPTHSLPPAPTKPLNQAAQQVSCFHYS